MLRHTSHRTARTHGRRPLPDDGRLYTWNDPFAPGQTVKSGAAASRPKRETSRPYWSTSAPAPPPPPTPPPARPKKKRVVKEEKGDDDEEPPTPPPAKKTKKKRVIVEEDEGDDDEPPQKKSTPPPPPPPPPAKPPVGPAKPPAKPPAKVPKKPPVVVCDGPACALFAPQWKELSWRHFFGVLNDDQDISDLRIKECGAAGNCMYYAIAAALLGLETEAQLLARLPASWASSVAPAQKKMKTEAVPKGGGAATKKRKATASPTTGKGKGTGKGVVQGKSRIDQDRADQLQMVVRSMVWQMVSRSDANVKRYIDESTDSTVSAWSGQPVTAALRQRLEAQLQAPDHWGDDIALEFLQMHPLFQTQRLRVITVRPDVYQVCDGINTNATQAPAVDEDNGTVLDELRSFSEALNKAVGPEDSAPINVMELHAGRSIAPSDVWNPVIVDAERVHRSSVDETNCMRYILLFNQRRLTAPASSLTPVTNALQNRSGHWLLVGTTEAPADDPDVEDCPSTDADDIKPHNAYWGRNMTVLHRFEQLPEWMREQVTVRPVLPCPDGWSGVDRVDRGQLSKDLDETVALDAWTKADRLGVERLCVSNGTMSFEEALAVAVFRDYDRINMPADIGRRLHTGLAMKLLPADATVEDALQLVNDGGFWAFRSADAWNEWKAALEKLAAGGDEKASGRVVDIVRNTIATYQPDARLFLATGIPDEGKRMRLLGVRVAGQNPDVAVTWVLSQEQAEQAMDWCTPCRRGYAISNADMSVAPLCDSWNRQCQGDLSADEPADWAPMWHVSRDTIRRLSMEAWRWILPYRVDIPGNQTLTLLHWQRLLFGGRALLQLYVPAMWDAWSLDNSARYRRFDVVRGDGGSRWVAIVDQPQGKPSADNGTQWQAVVDDWSGWDDSTPVTYRQFELLHDVTERASTTYDNVMTDRNFMYEIEVDDSSGDVSLTWNDAVTDRKFRHPAHAAGLTQTIAPVSSVFWQEAVDTDARFRFSESDRRLRQDNRDRFAAAVRERIRINDSPFVVHRVDRDTMLEVIVEDLQDRVAALFTPELMTDVKEKDEVLGDIDRLLQTAEFWKERNTVAMTTAWDAAASYPLGAWVKRNNLWYESKRANNVNEPGRSADWEVRSREEVAAEFRTWSLRFNVQSDAFLELLVNVLTVKPRTKEKVNVYSGISGQMTLTRKPSVTYSRAATLDDDLMAIALMESEAAVPKSTAVTSPVGTKALVPTLSTAPSATVSASVPSALAAPSAAVVQQFADLGGSGSGGFYPRPKGTQQRQQQQHPRARVRVGTTTRTGGAAERLELYLLQSRSILTFPWVEDRRDPTQSDFSEPQLYEPVDMDDDDGTPSVPLDERSYIVLVQMRNGEWRVMGAPRGNPADCEVGSRRRVTANRGTLAVQTPIHFFDLPVWMINHVSNDVQRAALTSGVRALTTLAALSPLGPLR